MSKKTFLFSFIVFSLCNNIYSRGTSSAVIVDVYGGLGFVNPADINAKIIDPDYGLASFFEATSSAKWAKNFGAFVGYQFNYRYSVGLLFDYAKVTSYLMEESDTAYAAKFPTSPSLNVYAYEFNSGGSAFSLGPAFNMVLYSRGRLAFGAGLGILYAPSVSYYEDIAAWTSSADTTADPDELNTIEGKGSAFGFLFNISGMYYFTDYFGTALNVGYRYLKASSLKDLDGNEIAFSFPDGSTDDSAAPMSMALSGIYFGLSLKLEFNFSGGKSDDSWSQSSEEGFHDELNTDWAPVEAAPSVNDLIELKSQARKKYQNANSAGDSAMANRYRRLYNIVDRIEKSEWDTLSNSAKKEKIEKIKRILGP
ncbi:MAG: hypothetical protein JXA66_04230 [Oligoflexia bacterium]|nr:hypothetical protein [Oligoflexia bacterium]